MTWRKFWFILFCLATVLILAFDRTITWWLVPYFVILAALCVSDWRAEGRKYDREQADRIIARQRKQEGR